MSKRFATRPAKGRRLGRTSLIAVAIIVAVSLSGCTGPGATQTQGIPISALRPKATAVEKSYYGQTLHWTPCSKGLTCATVREPLDWYGVTSKSIEIALVRHAATGTRQGDLVVNPGGPGGSGVDFVEAGVNEVVDSQVSQHYDVIGFDPRGVGRSAPVRCLGNRAMDKFLYGRLPGAIGSYKWIVADETRTDAFARACQKHTGPVLARVDSVEAAADMDVIRSALGDRRLNYLGYSYGTFLGTLYAGLFPHNVGRMVLDGADDPWGADYEPYGGGLDGGGGVDPADDGTVAQAVGFESDLTSYLSACVAGKTTAVEKARCPFHSSASLASDSVEQLLATVNADPITSGDGRSLDGATLATAIVDSLYDPSDWPVLTQMFVQVQSGDSSLAFQFADQYNDRDSNGSYHDNLDLAHLAVECLSSGSDTDISEDRAEFAELKRVAPVLGPYQAFGDIECDGWMYGPSPFPNPVTATGAGPILVLGTTGDPATPYSDAKLLAKQLSSGHLVTYHAEGHTAYNRGDSCIDATVDAYLLAGTVPTTDPQCH